MKAPSPRRAANGGSWALLATGFVLLVFKVAADSEPGALPLFLLAAGAAWRLAARARQQFRSST